MPPLLCHIQLPWCQKERIVDLPLGTDRDGLLDILRAEVGEAEVFVFVDQRIALAGQALDGGKEAVILPVLSGG